MAGGFGVQGDPEGDVARGAGGILWVSFFDQDLVDELLLDPPGLHLGLEALSFSGI